MNSYLRTKKIITVFLISYVIFSVYSFIRDKEFFPFFSWNLFVLVPHTVTQYNIRLTHHNETPINPPILYEYADTILTRPHSIIAYYLIQQIGKANAKNDSVECNKFRYVLEQNYLLPKMKYELVTMKYFPLERWKTGNYSISPIQQFSTIDKK